MVIARDNRRIETMCSRQKDEKDIFKVIAQQEGISVTELRKEMEMTIAETYRNQTPEQRVKFQLLFGDNIPTPEEFIYKMTKKLKKTNR